MICPKCGTKNPGFFRKCHGCGAELPRFDKAAEKRERQVIRYGAISIFVLGVIILIVLNLPAISGWLHAIPGSIPSINTTPRITQFAIGQPAIHNDVVFTVSGAGVRGTAFNGQENFRVTASIKNQKAGSPVHYSTNDFTLLDTHGNTYRPLSIDSDITYDQKPGTTGVVELVFIIPEKSPGLKLRFDPREPIEKISGSDMYFDFLL